MGPIRASRLKFLKEKGCTLTLSCSLKIGGQKLLTIFFIISLSLNVYFAAQFILLKMDLKNTAEQLRVQQSDEKALAFMNLFVNKILLAEGEVNFEDRLKLENA